MRRLGLFPLIFGLCLLTLFVSQLVAAGLLALVRPPPPAAMTLEQILADLERPGAPVRLKAHTPVGTPAFDPADGATATRLAALIAERRGLSEEAVVLDLARMQRARFIYVEEGTAEAPRLTPSIVGAFALSIRGPDGRWTVWKPRDEGYFGAIEQRYVVLFLLGAFLMLPLSWWLSRRLAAPFATFADSAERLGRDPSAEIAPLSGPAEVERANRALAEMARRLHAFVTDRTQTVGALAHDLRTPLTRLAFRVESLPPATRAEILDDVREMEAMVAATLSWVRGVGTTKGRERLDLGSMVERVAEDLSITGRAIPVACDVRAVVEGDPVALRRMFVNLFENALNYGRTAHAHVRCERDEAVVEIEDEGPGLPEAELGRVFEAFYRAEPSRNRNTGGIGLGLPFARTVARAHGGDIQLANRHPRGLVARVTLPLARMDLLKGEPLAPPQPRISARSIADQSPA